MARVLFAVFLVAVLGAVVWTQSDGYKERVRMQRALNDLELERLRRETELELKLKEWQHARSLEDLERHRRRLERDLDDLHTRPDPPPPEGDDG